MLALKMELQGMGQLNLDLHWDISFMANLMIMAFKTNTLVSYL
jgi:hypothetical protein